VAPADPAGCEAAAGMVGCSVEANISQLIRRGVFEPSRADKDPTQTLLAHSELACDSRQLTVPIHGNSGV